MAPHLADSVTDPAFETTEAQLIREGLISLSQAAKLLPHRRGRRPHASTVFRYATDGAIAGGECLRLEAVKLPGGWATSTQAVTRFLTALTEAAHADLQADACVEHFPRVRPLSRSARAAAAELDRRGIGVEPAQKRRAAS